MGLLHLMSQQKASDGNMLRESDDIRRNERSSIILEASRIYESSQANGQSYASRWPKISEGFESEDYAEQYKAALTVRMIEATRSALEGARMNLGEAVVQTSLGALNPRVLDIVRIFYPNQIAQDLVDIQPLNGQVGEIFTIN